MNLSSHKGAQQVKLLIVDDDVDLLQMMVKRISKRNHIVLSANTVDEAISQLAEHSNIEGVVSDLNLENGESGLKILKWMQEISRNIPFILVTGDDREDTRIKEFENSKFFKFLHKPYSLDILLEMLCHQDQ